MSINFANTTWCKKDELFYWNPGTWLLTWEYSVRAFQWIPSWQGLGGYQKSYPCALDESSLSIEAVNGLTCTVEWHIDEM